MPQRKPYLFAVAYDTQGHADAVHAAAAAPGCCHGLSVHAGQADAYSQAVHGTFGAAPAKTLHCLIRRGVMKESRHSRLNLAYHIDTAGRRGKKVKGAPKLGAADAYRWYDKSVVFT